MIPVRWWQRIIAYLCGGLLILAWGCKDAKPPDEDRSQPTLSADRYGGTYHKPFRQEPLTLDPALLTDVFAASVAHQLFDGLVQFDADLNVVPGIAQSWSASRDGLVWTFHLRQGVKFHHGREVTAQDFVYSFTRFLHPKTASPRVWLFERIDGAKKVRAGAVERVEGLRALDTHTLQITLSQPYAPFLSILGMSHAKVLPQEEVERLGTEFGRQPVGTGPFRFMHWRGGEEIVLEANAAYFDGRPFLDHLRYRIMPNHQGILAEFERGALDDVELTDQSDPRLSSEARFRFVRKPLLATLFLWMDTRQGPLSHHKVRQAINYAINREAISSTIRQNRHVLARGILPLGMPGYNPDVAEYTYNPAHARQLLADAGHPGGQGLPPIELWSSAKTVTVRKEDEAIQRDLEHVGISVTLLTADNWKHFKTEVLGKRPGAMYRHAWFADFPDPDNFLFSLFHSQSPNNYAHYRNVVVDKLLEQASGEGDYLQRIQLYRQAEALIMQDAPAVNLLYHTFAYLFQSYVRGIELNALGERHIPMKKIWLDVTHRASPTTSKKPQ